MKTLSAKTRYLLVTLAIAIACAVQLVRGVVPWVVLVGGLAFLVAGNAAVYVSGKHERAARLQKKRDYYAGHS